MNLCVRRTFLSQFLFVSNCPFNLQTPVVLKTRLAGMVHVLLPVRYLLNVFLWHTWLRFQHIRSLVACTWCCFSTIRFDMSNHSIVYVIDLKSLVVFWALVWCINLILTPNIHINSSSPNYWIFSRFFPTLAKHTKTRCWKYVMVSNWKLQQLENIRWKSNKIRN